MKKLLSLVLASLMFIIPVGAHAETTEGPDNMNSFSDTAENEFKYSIDWCYEKGIIKGTSDTTFSPDENVNRAMLVTVMYRLNGAEATVEDIRFSDVHNGDYFAEAVQWALQNDIVRGISETEFAPTRELTRQDAAVIFYRYAVAEKQDVTVDETKEFADSEQISEYAREAVNWAYANHVLEEEGYGVYGINPKGSVKRSQLASMLKRFAGETEQLYKTPIESEKIEKIELQSGATGDMSEITDSEKIAAFVERLNGFKYLEKRYWGNSLGGWYYRFRIVYADESMNSDEMTVISPSGIWDGGDFCESFDESLFSEEWLKEIFG